MYDDSIKVCGGGGGEGEGDKGGSISDWTLPNMGCGEGRGGETDNRIYLL